MALESVILATKHNPLDSSDIAIYNELQHINNIQSSI